MIPIYIQYKNKSYLDFSSVFRYLNPEKSKSISSLFYSKKYYLFTSDCLGHTIYLRELNKRPVKYALSSIVRNFIRKHYPALLQLFLSAYSKWRDENFTKQIQGIQDSKKSQIIPAVKTNFNINEFVLNLKTMKTSEFMESCAMSDYLEAEILKFKESCDPGAIKSYSLYILEFLVKWYIHYSNIREETSDPVVSAFKL